MVIPFTVNVPEGVDTIGNYAFAYNSNVKEVVLSSTVRDLGRGFDSSTVEKVVLNEGLTTISSRAFRSTTALKEVVFSSTVTTIADNAFQKSGIKTITIPANVKTIGETAFGASLVETVIIEGNTDIEGYAFRGCTQLRTVYLNGYDVNFVKSTLNGRNSIWFCNGESNNPNTSNITFYVKNAEIESRVKNAMGAEANNTTVVCEQKTVTDGNGGCYYIDETTGNALVYDAKGLDAALNSDNIETIVLHADLSFTSSDTTANSGYGATGLSVKGNTLDGNGNSLGIDNWNTWDAAVHTTSGTIKNLTINKGMRGIFMGSADGNVYIDNVIIDGTIYTFNSDGGSKNYGVYISNSTLNGWTSHSDVHKEVVYTNCNFGEGNGYAFCRPYGPTVFENCVFEEGFKFDTSKTSAIIFKNCYYGDTLITAENAATLGFGEITFFYNGLNGITINGQKIVANADELATAVKEKGATNLYLLDGEYDVYGCENKTLTISGSKNAIIMVVGGAKGEANGQLDYGFDGSTVTFNGVTIKTNNQTYAGYARLKGIYNNCTFENTYCLNSDSEFNNCTFNISGDQYNIWTWGAPNTTFNSCTFNSDGKAVLLYGTANTKLTINNCVFNDKGGLTDLKAAIEIGNDYGKSYELIVNNTTVNGYEINDKGTNTGTTLWANKNSMGTDMLNVVIDGVDVY